MPFDLNGQPTKPTHPGDIIEFIETTRDVGEVTRYRIVSGDDAQALTVEYLSGQNNLAVGEPEEVYIYPQNAEGVSKEYVDQLDELNVKLNSPNNVTTGFRIKNNGRTLISTGTEGVLKLYHVNDPTENEHAANKKYVDDSIDALSFTGDYLPTTGGDLTGQLNTNSLIKSTRNTGYALQVKPDGNEVAHIHTNGNAAFKDVTLKGNINMEGHVLHRFVPYR